MRNANEKLKQHDTLVIVGCGPYEEEIDMTDADTWIMGAKYFSTKTKYKPNALFEIHNELTLDRKLVYYDKLLKSDIPVICQKDYGFQNPYIYPIDEVCNKYKSRYFTNTISYMIGLGMYLGYKNIEVHCVNMLQGPDILMKCSIEYWLGRAEGTGITLEISETSDLLKSGGLYAWEVSNEPGVALTFVREAIINKMLDSSQITQIKELLKLLEVNREELMTEVMQRFDMKPGEYEK